jgi:hypothetical protein
MTMFNPAQQSRIKQFFPWLFVIAISFVYLWHFDNTNNDFQVFYRAGLEFRSGINPWNTYLETGAYYLNGASTLLLLSGLSIFSLDTAILILRLANLILVIFVIVRSRDSFRQIPPALIIVFILLAFPFRSAMEYGQLTIVFGSIAFLVLIRIWKNSTDSFPVILGLAFIVDFKPHLVIGLIAYLVLLGRVGLIFKAFFAWLIFQLTIGLYLDLFPFSEMIQAISFRSGTVTKGEDSFSVISFLNLDSNLSTITTIVSIVLFSLYLIITRKNLDLKVLPLFSFSLLLTPLLHPTDLIFLILVFVIKEGFTNVGFFVLGLFFVWSPQLSGAGFTTIVILAAIGLLALLNHPLPLVRVVLVFFPNIVYLSLVGVGVNEVIVRHSIHLFIPIFIGVYYSLSSSKIDSDAEKAG